MKKIQFHFVVDNARGKEVDHYITFESELSKEMCEAICNMFPSQSINNLDKYYFDHFQWGVLQNIFDMRFKGLVSYWDCKLID